MFCHAVDTFILRVGVHVQVAAAAEDKILEALVGVNADEQTRESMRALLNQGDLDNRQIDVEVPARSTGDKGTSLRVMWEAGGLPSLRCAPFSSCTPLLISPLPLLPPPSPSRPLSLSLGAQARSRWT